MDSHFFPGKINGFMPLRSAVGKPFKHLPDLFLKFLTGFPRLARNRMCCDAPPERFPRLGVQEGDNQSTDFTDLDGCRRPTAPAAPSPTPTAASVVSI